MCATRMVKGLPMDGNLVDIRGFRPPEGAGDATADPGFAAVLQVVEDGRRPPEPIRVVQGADGLRLADPRSHVLWTACRKVGSGIGLLPPKYVVLVSAEDDGPAAAADDTAPARAGGRSVVERAADVSTHGAAGDGACVTFLRARRAAQYPTPHTGEFDSPAVPGSVPVVTELVEVVSAHPDVAAAALAFAGMVRAVFLTDDPLVDSGVAHLDEDQASREKELLLRIRARCTERLEFIEQHLERQRAWDSRPRPRRTVRRPGALASATGA